MTTWDGGDAAGGGAVIAAGDARVHEAAMALLADRSGSRRAESTGRTVCRPGVLADRAAQGLDRWANLELARRPNMLRNRSARPRSRTASRSCRPAPSLGLAGGRASRSCALLRRIEPSGRSPRHGEASRQAQLGARHRPVRCRRLQGLAGLGQVSDRRPRRPIMRRSASGRGLRPNAGLRSGRSMPTTIPSCAKDRHGAAGPLRRYGRAEGRMPSFDVGRAYPPRAPPLGSQRKPIALARVPRGVPDRRADPRLEPGPARSGETA